VKSDAGATSEADTGVFAAVSTEAVWSGLSLGEVESVQATTAKIAVRARQELRIEVLRSTATRPA
jgi:hypothetical protein